MKMITHKLTLQISYKFALAFLLFVTFWGCTRQAGIKVNQDLTKNPAAFYLRSAPANVQKFIDSIVALPSDSIRVQDTVTVTINDTVYSVGFFASTTANKVALWEWRSSDGRILHNRKNNDMLPIAFADTGMYQVLFYLQDNINGVRQAGLKQWIHVINTLPRIKFISDTTWAPHKGPATFTFFAADSFGRVTAVLLDYNHDGKWDTTFAWNGGDSIKVTVPKDSATVDSLGNQKVAVRVIDDDGNPTTDTIIVHFNSPPQVFQDYPIDSSKASIYSRFAFYWHSTDSDNSKSVRYSLRVGKVPVLTSSHTVIANTSDRSWEQVHQDGSLQDSTLKGNLYWQVVAFDGFDTVLSPVHKFFLGDPNVKYGVISGVALMQGSARSDGIRITLVSGSGKGTLIGHTDSKYVARGDFMFSQVEPGCYRLDARDTVDLYYTPVIRDSICVDLGDTTKLDTILLLDKAKPHILLTSLVDTVYTRRDSISFSGAFADSGSGVLIDTNALTLNPKAWIDGKPVKLINPTQYSWSVMMDTSSMSDGRHLFTMVAHDGAGNVSDTLKIRFGVKATVLDFTVNGVRSVVVRGGTVAPDSLHFLLSVTNVLPSISNVYFSLSDTAHYEKGWPPAISPYKLDTAITTFFDTTRIAIALMRNDSGIIYRDTVKYRVRDPGKASVIFTSPSRDTTTTINSSIPLTISAQASDGHTIVTWDWDLDGSGNYATHGNAPYAFSSAVFGDFKIRVKVVDNVGMMAYDSVVIHVVAQPPVVHVTAKLDTVKVNGDIHLNASASATLPQVVTKYEWNCNGQGYVLSATAVYTLSAPASASTFDCIIQVTETDGEQAWDTTHVIVKVDVPYVKVLKDSATVTIRDSLNVGAQLIDTLGTITKVEWSCGLPDYAGVSGWKVVPKHFNTTTKDSVVHADTLFFAPKTAASAWLCVVRVTNDNNMIAMDTTIYRVLLDPPHVKVVDKNLDEPINAVVNLDAVAYDSLGHVIKYEWSCGGPGAAGVVGWKSYATPQASVTMPATGNANYMCVIRVMDDDSLTTSDTTFIIVEQDAPSVTVKKKYISTRVNQPIPLDCSASNKFGTILGYKWSCGSAATVGTTWDPGTGLYQNCAVTEMAPATGTTDYECIVQVSDKNGQTATDTAHVTVVQPPQAVIFTKSNKYPVWSGDLNIPDSNKYWNTAINGSASILGTPLGVSAQKQFWWNFSNYQPTAWFLGPADGSLDVTYTDFDVALMRPNSASNVKVRLDFRDSTLPTGVTDSTLIYDFFIRHLAFDSTAIQFARYWQNVGSDTVLEKATRSVSAVADAGGPYIAYREASSGSGNGVVKKNSGGLWSTIGGGYFGTGVDSIRMALDPVLGDVYVAFRNSSGNISVMKSLGGLGTWAAVGGGDIAVNGSNARRVAISAKNGKVAVAWIGNDSLGLVMTSVAGAAWGWNNVAAATGAAANGEKSQDIVIAFNASATDTLAVLYVNTGYTPKIHVARGTNMGTWSSASAVFGSGHGDAIAIAYASTGTIYASFNNRDNSGLRVRSATSGTPGTWSDVGGASNIGQHLIGTRTSIAMGADNYPIVAYDDNFFSPQISVWKYNGSFWILYGENLLPYFNSIFNSAHGYYLYANSPTLAVNGSSVYIGMQGRDTRSGGGNNSGPIVMKYTP